MTRTEIDPAEGETLAQAAYRALRHDIITGLRPPGERLRIAMLTTLYGVGPTPLREALQKLGQDGLVMAEDNRGFAVAGLDPVEFDDLNTARTAIETEATRLSIARGDDAWEARVVAASYIMQKEDAALAAAAGPVTDRWESANAAFTAPSSRPAGLAGCSGCARSCMTCANATAAPRSTKRSAPAIWARNMPPSQRRCWRATPMALAT